MWKFLVMYRTRVLLDVKLLILAFLRSLTAPAKGIEIMAPAPHLCAFFVTESFGWKGHRSLQPDPQSKQSHLWDQMRLLQAVFRWFLKIPQIEFSSALDDWLLIRSFSCEANRLNRPYQNQIFDILYFVSLYSKGLQQHHFFYQASTICSLLTHPSLSLALWCHLRMSAGGRV